MRRSDVCATRRWPLLLLTLLALPGWRCDQPAPFLDSELRVDDEDARGVVGDDRLSLAEAVALANGTLSLDALSPAEAAHISGSPGPTSADHVRVVLGKGAVIQASPPSFPGEPVVPYLLGNEGDLLDGGGVVLDHMGSAERTGMVGLSSGLRVRDFEFQGLRFGIVLTAFGSPPELSDVTIEHNVFRDHEGGVIVHASPGAGATLRGLEVSWNTFLPRDDAPNSILVMGAAPQVAGQVISGALVEDVEIVGNRIEGGFGGIYVMGGVTIPNTSANAVRMREIELAHNWIDGVFDVSLAVLGGFATGGGRAEDIRIEGVRIHANQITVRESPGTPIWSAAGVAVLEGGGGLVADNTVTGLEIFANRVRGVGDGCVGLLVSAGHAELTDGRVVGNLLEDAAIRANDVRGCENGVGIFAGLTTASAGSAEDNVIRQVSLEGNLLVRNTQGVNVAGGLGIESTALPGAFVPVPALSARNRVEDLRLLWNLVSQSEIGLNFVGGASIESPDVVVDNRVQDVSLVPNALRANEFDCLVNDDVLLGDQGGTASGNAALVACE